MAVLNLVVQHRKELETADSSRRREFIRKLESILQGIVSGDSFGAVGQSYTDATAASSSSSSFTSGITVSDGQSFATNLTATFVSVAAGTVFSVNGTWFYAVSGTPVTANGEFKRGVSDTADAASFVTAFNASAQATNFTATSALGVITFTPTLAGTAANAFTFETLGVVAQGNVACSSTAGTLTTTINGVAITATAGATDTASAAAIAAAINASSNALVTGLVKAYNDTSTCYIFSLKPGQPGNAITLAASGTGVTASGARLTGGAVSAHSGTQATGTVTIASGSGNYTVTINGVNASGTVAYNTSDTQTGADIADAINKNTNALVAPLIFATAAAGVVTVTAIAGGKIGNAYTLAATGTGTTVSGARLTGGVAPTTVVLAGGTDLNTTFAGARMTGAAQNTPIAWNA